MKPFLLLGLSGLLFACTSLQAHEEHPLSWIIGCWEIADSQTVECWHEASDGTLSGRSEMTRRDGSTFTEVLRIERESDTLVYIAQPGDAAPTSFTEISQSDFAVVFANVGHDYPQRITYTRNGPMTLRASIALADGSRERVFEFIRQTEKNSP